EGQRRYVESLSTYTKQFLERMEKPDVDEITGISPAIAIRQQNQAKSARSTVGTATEVYDYLRLLFARAGTVHCPQCDDGVQPDSPSAGAARVLATAAADAKLVVLFAVAVRESAEPEIVFAPLRAAGFTRVWSNGAALDIDVATLEPRTDRVEVVVDRIVANPESRSRLAEAREVALRAGDGHASVIDTGTGHRIAAASRRVCPGCRLPLPVPEPSLFSFNNPLGACPECRGFGNRLEFDERLIVPDAQRSLADGAVAPWATPKFEYYQRKLED